MLITDRKVTFLNMDEVKKMEGAMPLSDAIQIYGRDGKLIGTQDAWIVDLATANLEDVRIVADDFALIMSHPTENARTLSEQVQIELGDRWEGNPMCWRGHDGSIFCDVLYQPDLMVDGSVKIIASHPSSPMILKQDNIMSFLHCRPAEPVVIAY